MFRLTGEYIDENGTTNVFNHEIPINTMKRLSANQSPNDTLQITAEYFSDAQHFRISTHELNLQLLQLSVAKNDNWEVLEGDSVDGVKKEAVKTDEEKEDKTEIDEEKEADPVRVDWVNHKTVNLWVDNF